MITINETPPPNGKGVIERVKKVFKWLIITAVALVALAYAGNYGNSLYSDYQADKALTKRTGVSDWQWHWQRDKGLGNRHSSDVQWRISEKDAYLLRRVYGNHEVRVILKRNEDSEVSLTAAALWDADCEDGTNIETSATDGEGSPYLLRCREQDWGNALVAFAVWNNVDVNDLPRWSKNFDGFEVDEEFDSYEWDFQPAVRHLTLQSAKPKEETE